MRLSPERKERRGAVVVLLAILLIPLLAMVAFAVDMAWIVLTKTDLQNAADAAALAAASQLESGFVQYYLPGQTLQSSILSTAETNARTYAKNYASYNGAGGVNSLALNDSDIEFGFTDSSGTYTACPTYTGYPNTVKVTVRRDKTANGPLGLFFGPVLGTSTTNLQATAAATIYTGTLTSFSTNFSGSIMILPMTYDTNHWTNFLKTGQGPDGTTDTAANGAPQLQVYPSIKYTGNFGLLSLDQSTDGASTISSWITNGVSAGTIQTEINAGLLPLSSVSVWDWKGDPGLKTDDIHTLSTVVGQSYLLPVFNPVNSGIPDPSFYSAGIGTGTNYEYDIVGFVAVTITYVDNSSVHVQPSAMQVSNGIFTTVTPAAPPSSGTIVNTIFTVPKLSQ